VAKIHELPHEHLTITSHDGLKLQALWYPGESKKTMIWVHGYTSHAERESAFPGLFYHSLGFNVLIPYLRAHGPSQGKYLSFGPMEDLDIMQWVDLVNCRIPDGQIMIHGLSMGGGIVLDLATREMKNVKCLLSDAPSVTVEGIFRNVAKEILTKDADAIGEAAIQRYMKEFAADPADFDRVKNIEKGLYPLLLTAGSNEGMDETLLTIKDRNPMDTTVLILPGCNHGNGMYKQTEMYQTAIIRFVEKYMEN
jgi:pimeloyl-ACP methyl ester carboxylesterase